MNRFYEKASEVLCSTPAVVLFALWVVVHTAIQRDYISFISELAILLGLMILRAETVQAKRIERKVEKK